MEQNLELIYDKRFAGSEEERAKVWRVLTRYFFQRWVRSGAAVLDVGAGYCEFINNIQAEGKYALDLNPATAERAGAEVKVLAQDVTAVWPLASASINVVFSSNFFEHLPTKDALQQCLREASRVLRPGGTLLAMGPNIRFCYDLYWDFFDHLLPLSDRSLAEALELSGLKVERIVPRFLPFTMKGKKPPPAALIRAYLQLPVLWRFMGKQFLVVARKP